MPELFLNVLPKGQQRLWTLLQSERKKLDDWGYYLAGGTALALQIGHRQSVDFDFFSQKPALGAETRLWLESFPGFLLREGDAATVHSQIQGVKASFISGYKYPLIEKKVLLGKLHAAGIVDIAQMKLLAITHRATLRDYLDLAAILRDHIPLPYLLKTSKKKYGPEFNPMVSLKAMISFDDVDMELPLLLDKTLKKSWKDILRQAVKDVANN